MIRGLMTNDEWAIVAPFLTTPSAQGGRPPGNHRRVLDGIRAHAWEGRADGPVGPHQLPAPRGWLFNAPAQEAAS